MAAFRARRGRETRETSGEGRERDRDGVRVKRGAVAVWGRRSAAAAYALYAGEPRGGRRTEEEDDPDGWAPPVSDSEKNPLYLCFLPSCKLPF